MISIGAIRWRLWICAIGACAAFGCAPTEKRPPTAFEEQPWKYRRVAGTTLLTEHYEIHTTLRDRVLIKAIPDVLEQAYLHYQSLVPLKQPAPERMRVYVFAARDQWEDFTRRNYGPRSQTLLQVRNGGYTEGSVAVIQYVRNDITFPLLTHEGFHQYLHCCVNDDVPAWLNEGLATLCEGLRWDREMDRVERFDPDFNPSRRNDLTEGLVSDKLLSLRSLLQTHAGIVVQGPSRGVITYYGQVWALMLFLRDGEEGKYRAGFERLLRELGQSDLEHKARAAFISSDLTEFSYGESLFRAYIGEDLPTIEREYIAFMRARFLSAE